ncbi:MAG: hypothetical protein NT030_02850 [Candidatus Saganbacteria bacterium]|nr:hypothetical protein [Candidatus Saganbacteria bacterium]
MVRGIAPAAGGKMGPKIQLSRFVKVKAEILGLERPRKVNIYVPAGLSRKTFKVTYEVSQKLNELNEALIELASNRAKLYQILPTKNIIKYKLMQEVGRPITIAILNNAKTIKIDVDPVTHNFGFIFGWKAYSYFAAPVVWAKISYTKDELYNLSRGIDPTNVAMVGRRDPRDMMTPGEMIRL